LLIPYADATVNGVEAASVAPEPPSRPLDPDSRAWVDQLALPGGARDPAVERLHGYLLRVARFELGRRRATLSQLKAADLDDLATQAADDALVAILRKLSTYRGDSRFTTWAAKFAILEAGVRARRRAWEGREVAIADDSLERLPAATASPDDAARTRELFEALGVAIESELTRHQREVFCALALNDIPIDVLAERLNTTRGALYKTLHDARARLRAHLTRRDLL
jgi:RNA polymerase sigma-70 factor (ECF subfamily)